MASSRVWIMDGHNVIFAIGPLERLQRSDRRGEARERLVAWLEEFAHRRGERVLIVFDGHDLASNPDAIGRPLVETVYARRGEGAADKLIISRARGYRERGLAVTVVTNDVSTLAVALPPGVRHLGVREFWLKEIEERSGRLRDAGDAGSDKPVTGDFSDIEREMLALAAAEPLPVRREDLGAGGAKPPRAGGPNAPPAAGPASRALGEAEAREQQRLRRQRGRLRQERHLKRRRSGS